MEILRIRHNWPEPAGMSLDRPHGATEAVLLHFQTPVRLFFAGRWHETRPGAFIVFAAGTPHCFVAPVPLLHDWAHITGDIAAEMGRFGLAPDTLYQPSCGPDITGLVTRLESECFADRSYRAALCQSLFTQLWVLVARDQRGEISDPVPPELAGRLRALRADMMRYPDRDWSNEAMARYLHISVSRLYPVYRRMFSLTPNRDLILIRVEKGKNLLLQGESVTRAAELVGYSNVFHFIRQFRRITGLTPGRFAHQPASE